MGQKTVFPVFQQNSATAWKLQHDNALIFISELLWNVDSSCLPFVQVLAPLPQQTGVIIQPQQIVLASGNKVQGNTQVSISSVPSLPI